MYVDAGGSRDASLLEIGGCRPLVLASETALTPAAGCAYDQDGCAALRKFKGCSALHALRAANKTMFLPVTHVL